MKLDQKMGTFMIPLKCFFNNIILKFLILWWIVLDNDLTNLHGYAVYKHLVDLLLKAARCETYSNEYDFILWCMVMI